MREQIRRRHRLAVDRDRIAAFEIDRDIGRLIRRFLRIDGARIDVVRHLFAGIFQHLALGRSVQEVGVGRERRLAPFVLGDRYLVLFGEGDECLARAEFPLAPRRDDFHVGLERVVGKLEADLIVALAGRAMSHRIGADRFGDLDLLLGDERPRDRGAEQILSLVERVGAEHREDVIADEFLAQILDEYVFRLDAERERLGAGRLELLALAEIGGEGDHLAAVGRLQPFEDDRGVEPARIGEHDFPNAIPLSVVLRHGKSRSGDAGRPNARGL